jgi:glycosyltransferase involved in cell wall biosynthesis
MKIALLHDYFAEPGKSGGGEKLAIALAESFKADIYTGFVDKSFKGLEKLNVTEISRKRSSGLRTLDLMKHFEKLSIPGYDLYIFSGTNCITAAKRHHPNILYCHTPPRYLYDLRYWFDANAGFFGRMGLRYLRNKVYSKDQFFMRQFDKIVTNSENVRNRLLTYYEKDVYDSSGVVYSFVNLEKFSWKKPEGFYVSTARLDKLKRVDLIARAFKKMPDKKLYIISSGPELEKIKKMCAGCKNIELTGWLPEKEMLDLLSRCTATIQMPLNEDLGLGAIESMAAGKPCIAADEGGLRETVIDGKTGLLIDPDEKAIVDAVGRIDDKKSISMKKACLSRAKFFSRQNFIERMRSEIKEVLR